MPVTRCSPATTHRTRSTSPRSASTPARTSRCSSRPTAAPASAPRSTARPALPARATSRTRSGWRSTTPPVPATATSISAGPGSSAPVGPRSASPARPTPGASFTPEPGSAGLRPAGRAASSSPGPAHEVYVFYYRGTGAGGQGGDNKLFVRKSTNLRRQLRPRGRRWPICATTSVNGDLGLNGGLRSNSFPHAAVNPVSGDLVRHLQRRPRRRRRRPWRCLLRPVRRWRRHLVGARAGEQRRRRFATSSSPRVAIARPETGSCSATTAAATTRTISTSIAAGAPP